MGGLLCGCFEISGDMFFLVAAGAGGLGSTAGLVLLTSRFGNAAEKSFEVGHTDIQQMREMQMNIRAGKHLATIFGSCFRTHPHVTNVVFLDLSCIFVFCCRSGADRQAANGFFAYKLIEASFQEQDRLFEIT